MISFIHPVFLAGLAGVGLPVLIHFLTRPRPKVIRYPTYHLLVQAGSGRQALNRLRTWIVLILRTLAVLALVLAFAQPFLRSPGSNIEPGQPRRVVVVVDGSMSMRAGEGGVPIFAKARAQAADLLRSLEPGSAAGVIFMGAKPAPALPALSTNLASLHENLAKAEATLEKGDAAAALALAERMLAGDGAIYVFSDFQRTNWASVDLQQYKGVTFFLRPVVKTGLDNVGIRSIEKSPGEPIEGETIELSCEVFNATAAGRQETVRLDLEGVSQTVQVELQPFSSAVASFSFSLPQVGCFPGKVSLQPDNLNDDNSRHFKVRVRRALDVLVISDTDRSDVTSGAFFVAKALSPSEYSASGMRVLQRLSQEVDRGALETADAFFLISPTHLSGETAEIIARRVSDGANLVCFLDGPTAPDMLGALGGASKGGISPPYQLLRCVECDDARGEAFGSAQTHWGPLKLFNSPEQGDLTGLHFRRHYLTENVLNRKEEVLAVFADGSAGLSISPAGRGLAVFANFPIAPETSNAVRSPLFLPMLHELMRALRRTGETAINTPGNDWTVDVLTEENGDSDQNLYTLHGPNGETPRVEVLARGRVVRLAVGAVPNPGNYLVKLDQTPVDYAVVNVHPDETDTRQMNVVDLVEDQAEGGAAVAVLDAEGEITRAGKARPLWPILAALTGILIAAEMLVLALWRSTGQRAPKPILRGGTQE